MEERKGRERMGKLVQRLDEIGKRKRRKGNTNNRHMGVNYERKKGQKNDKMEGMEERKTDTVNEGKNSKIK